MHAFVRLFLPALLALAAVASPAADAPAMPDGCLVHLSVGPFTQVVANLDAAVATAVRKARGGYPAGIVGTMLPVLYPFALGDWRRDQPVHLLLFHADRPRMAAVIAVDDFVAFRNSLIEHRQPIETETNLPFAFRGWLRDGSAYWCAPLAGARAILADDAPTIERLTV
ncbi:MAG: hypothetical protein LIP77_10840, partial [Planctomycetes bacterium]|nr:hypothetical protein [Planctomycetota bacterium]